MLVNVPPTCARSSTVSTAENWPRNPVAPTTVCRSGVLTVTCGGGGGGGAGFALLRHACSPAKAAITTAMTATAAARPHRRRVAVGWVSLDVSVCSETAASSILKFVIGATFLAALFAQRKERALSVLVAAAPGG